MVKILLLQVKNGNISILNNAGSLIITTAVNSGLGFVYWWAATKFFPPADIGFASATISAMTFLSTLGMLGLGTLLTAEFAKKPGKEWTLITTSLLVAGGAGSFFGLLFAIIAPFVVKDFSPLTKNITNIVLFASGVGVTAVSFVLDQALVGLLKGYIQLFRNIIFAASKLFALIILGLLVINKFDLAIYSSWLFGNLISLLMLTLPLIKGRKNITYRPDWTFLRDLKLAALLHHLVNLALLAPGMILPLIVIGVFSATTNSIFYLAWMIASFAFVGPAALCNALYAAVVVIPESIFLKFRFTLRISIFLSLISIVVVFLTADYMLGFFGDIFAAQAAVSLKILVLATLAIVIKDHFIAFYRIKGQINKAILPIAIGGCFEIIIAAIGGQIGRLIFGSETAGLNVMCACWILGEYIQAAFMLKTVYRAASRQSQ